MYWGIEMDQKFDFRKYEESICNEILAVKDRVRNLIGDRHWQKEGEYKESILRSILRQYIPKKYTVGTGFIVGEKDDIPECSTQVDIIIFDSNDYPIQLREGDDFYIVEPDSVRAIIEVKSKVEKTNLKKAIIQMNDVGRFVFNHSKEYRKGLFVGIFAFEGYHYENYNEKNKESLITRIDKLFHDNELIDYINQFLNSKGHTNYITLNKDILIKREYAYYTYQAFLNPNLAFSDFFKYLQVFLMNYGKGDWNYYRYVKETKPIYEIKMTDVIKRLDD